jgi:hypothetical protein
MTPLPPSEMPVIFASAEEIDPLCVAEFCWFNYIMSMVWKASNWQSRQHSAAFPSDTVLEYAKAPI